MARIIDINLRPDERALRQFGVVALVGFGVMALLAWKEWLLFAGGLGESRTIVAAVFAGLGVISAFFSLVAPKANWPIYVALTVVTFPIGFVLSYVIMGVLFFGMFAPVALLFRLVGRDPLNRGYRADADSYWSDARPQRSKESYFRQF